MFKDSAWVNRYYILIAHAKARVKVEGYTEKHHIIPKCMGGTDDESNLATLTAREHLIAHRILVRCCAKEFYKKLLFALWAMATLKNKHSTGKRIHLTSRQYAKLREEYFLSRRGIPLSADVKAKISKTLTGNKIPLRVIEKRSATLARNIKSGKTKITRNKLTEDQKISRSKKIAETFTEDKRKIAAGKMLATKAAWSEEERASYSKKLSNVNTGKTRSKEQCANISAGLLASDYIPSAETKTKIGDAQRGKIKDPVTKFILKAPCGQIIERLSKAEDVCKEFNIGIKYLYLSLKKKLPIQSGKAKGWQLLSKTRIKSIDLA